MVKKLALPALLAVAATIIGVMFDHTMRLDQQQMCQNGDAIECPNGLWIWE